MASQIFFGNDYNRSGHPAVMQALIDTADQAYPGYGLDIQCEQAEQLILQACGLDLSAKVHFLSGGTQANATIIDAILRPWEGVLSADTGHINVHETGAVEHAGHKILSLAHNDGKISAAQIREAVEMYRTSGVMEHMVAPKLVYISQSTEYGTVYSLEELQAIAATCRELGLYLLIDGARLAYTLHEVPLTQIAALADVFTVGGTKCGALFGEAIVFTHPNLSTYFRHSMKQNSGLLAKGWLLGAQFQALFEDGLYLRIGARACAQAQRIAQACEQAGIEMLLDSPSNQQFVLLSEEQFASISERFVAQFIEPHPTDRKVVRFCTSWSTTDEEVDQLVAAIAKL